MVLNEAVALEDNLEEFGKIHQFPKLYEVMINSQ